MGVRVGEHRLDGRGSHLVVLAGDVLVQVHEQRVRGVGGLAGPVNVRLAADAVALPDFARDEGEDDGGGAVLAGLVDDLAQIPAVGVDGFVLMGDGVVDVTRVFAVAGKGAAGASEVVERTVVVMAELHQNEVAGMEEGEDGGPVALQVGAAAGASVSAIDDVDAVGAEVRSDLVAPSPLAVGAVALAVADRRVADDPERGEVWIGWGGGCL